MKQFIIILILSNILSLPIFGQREIKYTEKNGISITLPNDWSVEREDDKDEGDNLYFLKLKKDIQGDCNFLELIIRLDHKPESFFKIYFSSCIPYQTDTINYNNHKTIRLFSHDLFFREGINCDNKQSRIEWFIQLDKDKYVDIIGTYNSGDEMEKKKLKKELLLFVGTINIR
jgi:hypothetical protein